MNKHYIIPYGRQSIDSDDIAAVVSVLKSEWLTCGPAVEAFENALAAKVGTKYAVAVSSGTAALHAAMFAIGVRPGDEVIVPPITFAATANCVVFQGGTPVFADVDPGRLLIDPKQVECKVTKKTKAIIAVDFAGHPCDYDVLRGIAEKHHLHFVTDACHALGATYNGHPVGSLADLSAFSFHPVKHITTGEGGMITTDSAGFAQRMRDFRTHGITRDAARFGPAVCEQGAWFYEMQSLGYNDRMPDINAALGLSQLKKLDRFVARRREIASMYSVAFSKLKHVKAPRAESWAGPSWHLYVLQVDFQALGRTRNQAMKELQSLGVGTQVHYIPVHLHPFYRQEFGVGPGLCPVAESVYPELLSLPIYPAMSDEDVEQVIAGVKKIL